MRNLRILIALVLLSAVLNIAAQTAENDTLLRVLREELAADFAELQKQDVKPYFMSFRVQESFTTRITATYGFLSNSIQTHKRTFTPQIRVGTPELDNFKFTNQSRTGSQDLPLADGSADALRSAIWTHMLDAYDRSAEAYRNVQSRLRSQADNEDKAPCFTLLGNSPAESYYEPPLTHPSLTPDEQREWEERLCRITAVFRKSPQFNDTGATLQVENQRTHLVNSEGTAIVQNRVSYRVFIQAEIKTNDGMVLPLSKNYYATSLDDLPAEDIMIRDAEDVRVRLQALAEAPVADPFTGPALMSGEASGVFFHEIFGHRLEGHRMKTGGQTFRKMVGEQVLPTEFQVYCDPTLTHYGAQPLNGGYRYDDEGTRARRVDNVVNGVLKEFLMSRVPLDSFPQSNGHGRTAEGSDPVSRQSNLIVETSHPYTEAQLRQLLLDEARRQDKPYGYLFQSVSGGFTQTGEGGSINSFNVKPLEVYRIYVDGRPDELVRGVDLIGTPLSMFSNITAGGDTPKTFIGSCGAESGWVPVSTTSPMVFCSKIETQRRQQKSSLMPVLNPPDFTTQPSARPNGTLFSERTLNPQPSTDSLIFAALSDELQRSMDSLRIEGQPAPFIIDYFFLRDRNYSLEACLGEIMSDNLTPWRQRFRANVTLGDYHHSSFNDRISGSNANGLPMALNYDNIRRAVWFGTDTDYKRAISLFEERQERRKKTNLPPDEAALPDLLPSQPTTNIQHRTPEAEDLHLDELRDYARRLSLIPQEFPELMHSEITIRGYQSDVYRLTTEGVKVAQPACDHWELDFYYILARLANGSDDSRRQIQEYATAAELLADSARFTQRLRTRLREQLDLQERPIEEDYYIGPVLFMNHVGINLYTHARSGNFIATHNLFESDRRMFSKFNRKIIDEKLTIRQDPTISTWEGKPIWGYYTADANGQAPQPITLVDHGIFRGQLCGLEPSLVTSKPTGNLRFSTRGLLGVHTASGIIRVESSETMSLEKMKRLLLRTAQRQGYDHAYIRRPTGFYRISVKDESETLMPGLYVSLSSYHYRHITALSTEQEALVEFENFTPFTVIGPQAMLISDLEVPTATPRQTTTPTLTYPLHRK